MALPNLQIAESPAEDAQVNVLLVDDEPANLLALEAVLEEPGLNLVRANSGKEALRELMHADYSVILLDVLMPVMDGFETARLIRARAKCRAIPIIFLTAAGKTEFEMFRGYEVGAVDYLLKPVVPAILKSKVGVWVDLSRKTAELRKVNATLEDRVAERTLALEQRSLELARSNEDLEQFAYSASHDLQEPLRTITSYLQLVTKRCGPDLGPEAREFIAFTVEAAGRMRSLIDALLEYSRLGQQPEDCQDVDSRAVAEAALDALATTVSEVQAECVCLALPRVRANPYLLQQVIQNLVGNALKYTNGKRPVVEVGCDEGKAEWVFRVKDNGIGIESRYFEQIFRVFQRLHTRDEYPGTGMGLAVCRKAVERMGGRIWCESEPGRGSTFYFTLPKPGKAG